MYTQRHKHIVLPGDSVFPRAADVRSNEFLLPHASKAEKKTRGGNLPFPIPGLSLEGKPGVKRGASSEDAKMWREEACSNLWYRYGKKKVGLHLTCCHSLQHSHC